MNADRIVAVVSLGVTVASFVLYLIERSKRLREETVRRQEQDRALGAMRRIEDIVLRTRDDHSSLKAIASGGYLDGTRKELSEALGRIAEVVRLYMSA